MVRECLSVPVRHVAVGIRIGLLPRVPSLLYNGGVCRLVGGGKLRERLGVVFFFFPHLVGANPRYRRFRDQPPWSGHVWRSWTGRRRLSPYARLLRCTGLRDLRRDAVLLPTILKATGRSTTCLATSLRLSLSRSLWLYRRRASLS